jgi:SynChlorMet cassette protein ScmC
VVRDAGGSYWAHPWPTWSQLLYNVSTERRDAQKAAPLKAIFILDQAGQDRATPAGGAAAVCMLMEVARQANWRLWLGDDLAALRAAQATRFDALCALVKAVPVYLLDVSLEGEFWKEIEKVI